MKVLWLCNMPLPDATKAFGLNSGFGGGWLSAEFEQLKEKEDIELFACFPLRGTKEVQKVSMNGATHYSIPRKVHSFFRYDSTMEQFFKSVVEEIQPDIIHIHGTENTPAWSLMKACLDQIYVVSLQGIISMIAYHQHACLPNYWQKSRTIWDFLSKCSPKSRAKMYRIGGKYEQKVIQRADYIMGRTEWDKICAEMLGSKGKYVYAPRILREPFYHADWRYESCQKYRIFSSAASTSIKGAHFLLEACSLLVKDYPDLQICFAGSDPYSGGIKKRFRRSGYEKYIHQLIRKYGLNENVVYLGGLSAEKMAEEMKKANVYVHPASIDNSPNALAEAMMVGTPCIASYSGGIPSMLKDKTEGLLYQYDAPYLLAYYIRQIFEDSDFAGMLSQNAKKRAMKDHDKSNAEITYNLYQEIIQESAL